MKKRLLIVEGWDIAVDEDYVNKFGISNNDSEDNSNESNFSLVSSMIVTRPLCFYVLKL